MSQKEAQINITARRFFLGALSDEEKSAFEAEFIADQETFDQVRAAEDELVEEYGRESLGPDEKKAFEANYLTVPQNRERVAFTRAMIARLTSPRPKQLVVEAEKPALLESILAFLRPNRPAFAAAFVIVITVGMAWVLFFRQKGPEIVRIEPPVNKESPTPPPVGNNGPVPTNPDENIKVQKPSPPSTPDNKNVNKPAEPPAAAPTLALFAGTLRSGGKMPELELPPNAPGARLQLNLESRDYNRYSADIVDADGKLITRIDGLRPRGTRIDVFLTTARVKTGEYRVKLSGMNPHGEKESAADYSFRLIRK